MWKTRRNVPSCTPRRKNFPVMGHSHEYLPRPDLTRISIPFCKPSRNIHPILETKQEYPSHPANIGGINFPSRKHRRAAVPYRKPRRDSSPIQETKRNIHPILETKQEHVPSWKTRKNVCFVCSAQTMKLAID